jgi:hypothetical protein
MDSAVPEVVDRIVGGFQRVAAGVASVPSELCGYDVELL